MHVLPALAVVYGQAMQAHQVPIVSLGLSATVGLPSS